MNTIAALLLSASASAVQPAAPTPQPATQAEPPEPAPPSQHVDEHTHHHGGEEIVVTGHLVRELDLLAGVRVVVVLGAFAYEAVGRVLGAAGAPLPVPRPRFTHQLEVPTARAVVLGCFHPSQQNTFTGKLTPAMIDAVLARAVQAASARSTSPA